MRTLTLKIFVSIVVVSAWGCGETSASLSGSNYSSSSIPSNAYITNNYANNRNGIFGGFFRRIFGGNQNYYQPQNTYQQSFSNPQYNYSQQPISYNNQHGNQYIVQPYSQQLNQDFSQPQYQIQGHNQGFQFGNDGCSAYGSQTSGNSQYYANDLQSIAQARADAMARLDYWDDGSKMHDVHQRAAGVPGIPAGIREGTGYHYGYSGIPNTCDVGAAPVADAVATSRTGKTFRVRLGRA